VQVERRARGRQRDRAGVEGELAGEKGQRGFRIGEELIGEDGRAVPWAKPRSERFRRAAN